MPNKWSSIFTLSLLFFCLADLPVPAAEMVGADTTETGTEKVVQPDPGPVGDKASVLPEASTHEIDSRDAISEDERVPGAEADEGTVVDVWHQALSGSITGTAEWIDYFFYDERIAAEENQSRLRLRLESFSEEGQGTDMRLRVSLRIAIPYMQERFKLIVTGQPEGGSDIEDETGTLRRPVDRIDNNDVTVSLQQSVLETLNRYLTTRLGFVIRNWKPRLFLEGRYRTFFDLDPWGVRFTERLRWYTDKGWESRTTLDCETPLSAKYFFRATVEGDWLEDQDGYPHSLTFNVSQIISPRRAVEYAWGNSFQSRPNYHLEEIVLALRYRQRIWRDWLFYDLEPQVRFPKSDEFHITPGILLRIEAIIGKYKRL